MCLRPIECVKLTAGALDYSVTVHSLCGVVVRATAGGGDHDDVPRLLADDVEADGLPEVEIGQVVLGDLTDLLVDRILLGLVEFVAGVLKELVDCRVVVAVALRRRCCPVG